MPHSPQHERRLQFATTVLMYAEHHGVTLTRAFEWGAATFETLDGRPQTYGAFKKFISRNRHHLSPPDALSAEISAVFDSLGSTDEGGYGGSHPSAVEGTEEQTRHEARKLDRDERDRFLRQTIATLTESARRDPAALEAIIRHYAELMADR